MIDIQSYPIVHLNIHYFDISLCRKRKSKYRVCGCTDHFGAIMQYILGECRIPNVGNYKW